ncbi:LacI family DNA-binding transcriptional regulator [uncultured Parolsenella sp.]|uniref:LacI family DNA-binding transcriptional regulator n=1 Tax=uncultured Parolsenella sp. TaxID=2083008 RepID=UPI0025DBA824|nr:LacI family DNA-binding transcriptional regulator [uncultured Parolsenella sp.]
MAPKVTLKEIAREVGLSPTSVSLVLNNKPCKISEANRKRIKEVARKKHYIPNQIARSLVTQHSHTLGLIVPNIESRFFSSLAKNLELRCRKLGYALFITNSDESPTADAELVRLLVNRGIDGLFLVVSDEFTTDAQLLEDLSQLPVPYVMVDRFIDGLACDKVRFDNVEGGYLACRHLIECGHRRIACIANTRSHTGDERVAGYRHALDEAGLPFDESLVLHSDYYIPTAYEAAGQLTGLDVTGVLATSDNIALGVLKRLYEEGRRVPRDYSVVSYDNSAADSLFEPALTSIEQNVGELSEAAIGLILQRLDEYARGEEGKGPQERLLTPRLVLKDSVRELG